MSGFIAETLLPRNPVTGKVLHFELEDGSQLRFQFNEGKRKDDGKRRDIFGGTLLKKSHAKYARPLDSKLPLHLVLRAQKSVLRLPKTIVPVNETVRNVAIKYGVVIYRFANVGNHLHFLIKLPRRGAWSAFIRELTGRIAQALRELGFYYGKSFWLHRPFTRIVRGWRKAFEIAKNYVYINELEGDGEIVREKHRRMQRFTTDGPALS